MELFCQSLSYPVSYVATSLAIPNVVRKGGDRSHRESRPLIQLRNELGDTACYDLNRTT